MSSRRSESVRERARARDARAPANRRRHAPGEAASDREDSRESAASSARASLARALSLTDSDLLEDISFELAKNRKRRLTKRTAPPPPPRQRRPKPPSLPDADYESDDFVDEDGVSILQAFEPSTDEETDDDDDDDAFVVRGMTSDDDDDDDDDE